MSLFSTLPEDVFIYLIEVGDVRGKDLIGFSNLSKTLYQKCNRDFNNYHTQHLFRRLLTREFNFETYWNDRTPRQLYIYYCKGTELYTGLIVKLNLIIKVRHTLCPLSNVFDLLYADATEHDGPNPIGSCMIEVHELPNGFNYLMDKYTPEAFFSRAKLGHLELDGIPILVPVDLHTPNLRFDYNLMKGLFGIDDDNEFKSVYEAKTDKSIEALKEYPALFAAELSHNPLMLDREEIKDAVRKAMSNLSGFIYEAMLTTNEIDFLVDVHFKIMDPQHPLKINDLVTEENLIR